MRPAGLAVLVLLLGVAAGACDTGYKFSTSSSTGSATTHAGGSASTVPSAPMCQAHDLAAKGGRRQDSDDVGGAIGDVVFSNTGTTACELRGVPSIRLAKANGMALDVTETKPSTPELPPVVVQPRGKSTAELVFTWTNWCSPSPGALHMQITLANGGGSVTAPLNGRLGDYVPTCGEPTMKSVLKVQYAYVPAKSPLANA